MEISSRDFAYPPESSLHYTSYTALVSPWDETSSSEDEINGRAVAMFDFAPENENEIPLYRGQVVWINYRYGQGWLVAEDGEGDVGLVPEGYVQLESDAAAHSDQDEDEDEDEDEDQDEGSPKQLYTFEADYNEHTEEQWEDVPTDENTDHGSDNDDSNENDHKDNDNTLEETDTTTQIKQLSI